MPDNPRGWLMTVASRWLGPAHLLEKTGDTAGACEHYRRAAKSTASTAKQRCLESRASRLGTSRHTARRDSR